MRTDRASTVRPRRGPGLRLRLTMLATGLVAAVSGLLLWLAWLLAGAVVSAVPTLPDGTTVRVRGVDVDAAQLGDALSRAARSDVLRAGTIAFLLVVALLMGISRQMIANSGSPRTRAWPARGRAEAGRAHGAPPEA